MTIHQAYQQLLFQLFEIYDDSEAHTIADWVMENITEWKRIDRIVHKEFPLSPQKETRLQDITRELMAHRPVQYVLGEAWFDGMKFNVNENVLIPRPETEELVEWIVTNVKSGQDNADLSHSSSSMSIIDIGTGSGCIPIALKKQLPRASLTAVDTSPQALQTALANARLNNAEVEFKQLDFLDQNQWQQLGKFDIIVSNPPYIKKSEAASMRKNVLDYEPALALFVPNEDPLVFYRYLADFGLTHSKEQGMLFAEINEALGEEVVHLFQQKGYIHVELKKDMQGKDRMVKAMVPMRFS